jgi:Domain of unknown function (DUF4258)
MPTKRLLPDDPLDFIRRCVRERKILWTYHANMRLHGRFLERQSILDAVEVFEIIESYPDDKYLPSYLVHGEADGMTFHVLFAVDVAGDNVRIVTSYRPDPRDWEQDLKTRRKP